MTAALCELTLEELADAYDSGDEATAAAVLAETARRDAAEQADRKRRQRNARGKATSEWYDAAYAQYLDALAYCQGNLLSALGKAEDIQEDMALWSGPEAWATPRASEELRNYWLDHPRLTVTEFARQQHEAMREIREEWEASDDGMGGVRPGGVRPAPDAERSQDRTSRAGGPVLHGGAASASESGEGAGAAARPGGHVRGGRMNEPEDVEPEEETCQVPRGLCGGTPFADVEPVEPEWLWDGRIPAGEVTVIAADGGTGKTFAAVDLAARITRGDALPGGTPATAPGSVIIASAEDDPSTVLAWRLMAARADMARVIDFSAPGGGELQIGGKADCSPLLHEAISAAGDVRLVILDPLAGVSAVGLTSVVRVRAEVMRPLQRIARSTGAAIVVLHHNTKAGQVAGSKAVVDAARSVLQIVKTDDSTRVVSVYKSNMARDEAPPVRYRLDGTGTGTHVEWLGEESSEGREGGPAQSRVLMALASSATALSGQKLASMTGIPYGSVRVILTKLKKRGEVASEARGLWFVPAAGETAPEPVAVPAQYGVIVEQPQVSGLAVVR
jgi:AAA domain